MANTFFISDTHFGHSNILKFEPKFRPFTTIEEMNEAIVERWNSIVRPEDTVWHLGDVFFGHNSNLNYAKRLMGKKKLVLGNHDVKHNIAEYAAAGFTSFYGITRLDKYWISHAPVHPQEFSYRAEFNIHGHTHGVLVKDSFGNPDSRYINVCVERTGCVPIAFEDIQSYQRKTLEAAKNEK